MKKTACAVLAAALFLLVVNYNERDALPAAHVRGLKQYLQTSGTETISMVSDIVLVIDALTGVSDVMALPAHAYHMPHNLI